MVNTIMNDIGKTDPLPEGRDSRRTNKGEKKEINRDKPKGNDAQLIFYDKTLIFLDPKLRNDTPNELNGKDNASWSLFADNI